MHINYRQRFISHPLGRLGLTLAAAFAALCLIGPWLSPYAPQATSYALFAPPSGEHWLGTNDVGQDILACLLAGGRTSFLVALGVAFSSTALACLVGALSAMGGGWVDRLLMRLTDVLLAVPHLVLILLVSTYLSPSPWLEIALFSLLLWGPGARVIRAQALSLKERAAVYAAAAFGAGKSYLFARHIFPDLVPLLSVLFLQGARQAVFMEAGLSFIGLADPNTVSWGAMIRHALGFTYLEVWMWCLLPVGAALSVTMVALTCIGHALEEMVKPPVEGHGVEDLYP
ncbi:peptide abc transporter, permease protein [Heliomicrobium modesticaldum Ice1]|uniref:Peptide abc transporter, permease protein n=1 Tax=Heliobacterium modesticaldum (strain ATCC 51547 / Ice1) TaxID=498761 RepID=B0TFB6_HELMI|nr:ABC transporter permease [Heliomicrobium modesticaldum]ABZ84433.1 peptide abc transporter, permease protein [Heliomicrobium modesticaldum Ice1]